MEEKVYQNWFGISITELRFELKYCSKLKKLHFDCLVCNHKLWLQLTLSLTPSGLSKTSVHNATYSKVGKKELAEQYRAQGYCKAGGLITSYLF